MGWYEKNIGYSRESRNYYRKSVLAEIRENRMRRYRKSKFSGLFIANLFLLVLTACFILFGYQTKNTVLKETKFILKKGIQFEVKDAGSIHEIQLHLPYKTKMNRVERNSGVLLDLYDPKGKRIYSFYKNLWWYKASSSDKGKSSPLSAKIILKDQGVYKIYAYVVDDELMSNTRKIDDPTKDGKLEVGNIRVESKTSGGLYYPYLIFLEILVLVAFLILSNYVGSFRDSIRKFRENWKIVLTAYPLLYMALISSLLLLFFYWNSLGIGYAGYEDYLHSPNWFFENDEVIYIG